MREPNDIKILNPQSPVKLRRGRYTRWVHANVGKAGSYNMRRNALKREQRALQRAFRIRQVAACAAAGVKAIKLKVVHL